MTNKIAYLEVIQKELEHPTNGFVGVADCLLELGRDSDLVFEWRDQKCRVTRLDYRENAEFIEVPLSKPKVRAVLANIAVRSRISPYGGEGMLKIQGEPKVAFQIELTNTAGKQHLTLKRSPETIERPSPRKFWTAIKARWKAATCLLILACAVIAFLAQLTTH
jgi:hypothetical protein